jgi:ComEC/Rec2-related protein
VKLVICISILLLQIFFTRLNCFDVGQKLADSLHLYAFNFLEKSPSSWNWFYEALLIGREEALRAQPILQSFLVIGLYHMMVGTGTHVLALEVILLKLFFFVPVKMRKPIVLLLLILFCFVNRLKPPCVRAVISRILFFKKPKGAFLQVDSQMIVTFFCLTLEPQWSLSLSFQFSCAATMALAMAATFHNSERPFSQKIISASLCSIVTFPLVLGLQPCVSWMVVPMNTIALPLFEGVFMPISILTIVLRPVSTITEKILNFIFSVSDYLAQFEKPLVCLDERKMASWGLIYLCAVYCAWRFVLPWFFRRRFWRNQNQFKIK